VDKVAASAGGRIEPDEPLFVIINPTLRQVQAQAPEARLTRIKPELGAVLRIDAEDSPVMITNGLEFVAMGRELDPLTRTLLLTYELKNNSLTTLDWERLVARVGPNWPLLLSQVLMFGYVYPGYRSNIPRWVPEQLLEKARAELDKLDKEEDPVDFTRGPLISRFSFMIDVREWGFGDPRSELVREARNRPEILAIAEADVWDERSEDRVEPQPEPQPEHPQEAIADVAPVSPS
jgi:hypothetical protein